jgi:hypothetical protein
MMKSTLVFGSVVAVLGVGNIAAALKLDLTSDGMLKPISNCIFLNLDI